MKKPPTRHEMLWARYYVGQLLAGTYTLEMARAETLLGHGPQAGPGYVVKHGRIWIGVDAEGPGFDFASLAAPPVPCDDLQLEFPL